MEVKNLSYLLRKPYSLVFSLPFWLYFSMYQNPQMLMRRNTSPFLPFPLSLSFFPVLSFTFLPFFALLMTVSMLEWPFPWHVFKYKNRSFLQNQFKYFLCDSGKVSSLFWTSVFSKKWRWNTAARLWWKSKQQYKWNYHIEYLAH